MRGDIKKTVNYYIQKFQTNDPFEIANCLNIELQLGKLDFEGCYMFLKNHKCIFLNQDLVEPEKYLVMAHELGHAILHKKQNCYFIKNKTFFLNSKVELEANTFAIELLVPDDVLLKNKGLTTTQLSRLLGYDQKILELKINNNV